MKKNWKRRIAMALACAAVLTLASIPTFATATAAKRIETLTGAPIDEDGVQYSDIGDTITPGQTIYFLLPGEAGKLLNNTTNIRVTTRKTQNAKFLGNISVVSKRLTTGSGSYSVPSGFAATDAYAATNTVTRNVRNNYIAVELKDYTGTEEVRIEFEVSFTVRKSAAKGYGFTYGTGKSALKSGYTGAASQENPIYIPASDFKTNGDKITLKAVLFIGNKQNSSPDITIQAGSAGQTIDPVAGEENTVTFEDRNNTLATLTYHASSNPEKFFAKLSTKWTSNLLTRFDDAEAFIWRFSAANIDSSSRATLALNNPFDEDSVDPFDVYIYTVDSNGVLKNVTSSFSYDEDEDTFSFKTRTLGTYIISDTKI